MRGLSGTFSALVAHTSKVVLYGELSTGHRDRGAPKKRYQDCLKKSLNVCHIDCQQWSDMAVDPGATSPQGCFTVWREPERLPQRQTTEEESSSCFHHRKSRPDLHVPTLHEDLPVSHRPPQPRTGLQSAWTTTILIFVREAKPNKTRLWFFFKAEREVYFSHLVAQQRFSRVRMGKN